MCCFSKAVHVVSDTQIFARPLPNGRQALAYQMSLAADEDLAMVLPLPTPAGSPEDAVEFVDLSGYPELFEDLDAALPAMAVKLSIARGGTRSAPKPLAVQTVGDFEASFVPSAADFDRLDPRFRLPDGIWDGIPGYAGWGFAVFKLRGLAGGWLGRMTRRTTKKRAHPMAFTFPRRDPSQIFFPTLHVHDGELHPEARFDHSLFWQDPAAPEPPPDHLLNAIPEIVEEIVDIPRSQGLVTGDLRLFRKVLEGRLPNRDTWI